MSTTLEEVSDSQSFLVQAGFYGNHFLRGSVRSIERICRAMPTESEEEERRERIWRAVSLIFQLPLAALLLIPATACYCLAAFGPGRFEVIQPNKPKEVSIEEPISIGSWNSACQDPWSPLSAGVVPPHEPTAGFPTRIAAIIDRIAQANLTVYVGQEWESLGAQEEGIERLKKEGFQYFVRDLGATNPFLNNSGLFVASKVPITDIRFTAFPWDVRSGIAKCSCQGALSFNIPLKDRQLTVVNAHLNYPTPGGQAARIREMNEYVAPLLQPPAVLLGDLNYDTSTAPLPDGLTNALQDQLTCSDKNKHILRRKPKQGCSDCTEKIDGVIFNPAQIRVQTTTTQYPECSDHFLIQAQITLISS